MSLYIIDDAGEFVSEERRRHDHAGVVSTLEDFEVSAVSECDFHFDQHFSLTYARDRHLLDLHVLFAVEDGGCHLSVQFLPH